PVLTIIVGYWEPRRVSQMAVFATGLAFGAALWGAAQDEASWSTSWVEAWNVSFAVTLDGLAAMYALLASGIGLLVVLYSAGYMPLHRAHVGQRPVDDVRFYGFLLLFMASMVGLVLAQDLFLLFVFWDMTAIASYFLIGFDREDEESRESALMALLVTGVSAIGVLIGAVILWHEYGTFLLPLIFEQMEPSTPVLWAVGLILAGALAKSAQFPLHFWLPRAMAAPTPVSSYLHSAAMVAAGVFLIGRIYPLVALDSRLQDALVVIGGVSMVVGGLVALTRDVFKQVLAYSTISQYGYVVVLFGLGGTYGVGGAMFYVIAHALAKSALFMTAGAITEATGEKGLSGVGGLAGRMPLLALGSGLAAMSMMALPLSIGFFKDELFFAAATEAGRPMQIMAIIGATLSFAYIGRLWIGWFLGDEKAQLKPLPRLLIWPIVALGAMAALGGIVPGPFRLVAEEAASVSYLAPIELSLAYHLDTRPENVMAVIVYALGVIVVASQNLWRVPLRALVSIGQAIGPLRIYAATLRGANALSDSIHRFEVRDLRSRIATILFPAGLLVAMAVMVTPTEGAFVVGSIEEDDLPLVLVLAAAAVGALVVTFPRDHLRLALTLSIVGFSLSVVYAFLGAPDVALVAVLIETLFAVVFFGMLVLMPRSILRYETSLRPERRRVARDAALATVAGVMAFLVAWGTLSRASESTSVIRRQIELAPLAHGYDIVTVILADFRGFDTMGEITVVAIAFLGIISLIRAGRIR
ncbi:MAG: DUF4040 domain-containing protein, partial [Chloroflexota bacterium]|nr:DUF4040 domain-containing protein [Chloroflexota bacterium]